MIKPLSEIRNLQELEEQRALLRKRAAKQEQRILQDTQRINREWHNAFRGITIARRVINFVFPKLDIITQLLPIMRIFRKK